MHDGRILGLPVEAHEARLLARVMAMRAVERSTVLDVVLSRIVVFEQSDAAALNMRKSWHKDSMLEYSEQYGARFAHASSVDGSGEECGLR